MRMGNFASPAAGAASDLFPFIGNHTWSTARPAKALAAKNGPNRHDEHGKRKENEGQNQCLHGKNYTRPLDFIYQNSGVAEHSRKNRARMVTEFISVLMKNEENRKSPLFRKFESCFGPQCHHGSSISIGHCTAFMDHTD